MRSQITALLLAGGLAASGCAPYGPVTANEAGAALTGGALGAITGAVLSDDPAWVVVGALGGAAAGSLVARNQATGNCAYARGDGTYYRAPCPS